MSYIDSTNFNVVTYFSNTISSSIIQSKNLIGSDAKLIGQNANYLAGNGFVSIPEISFYTLMPAKNERLHVRFYNPITSNNNTRYWTTRTSGTNGSCYYEITSSVLNKITTYTGSLAGFSSYIIPEQINYTSSFNSASFDDVNFVMYYTSSVANFYNLSCFYSPMSVFSPTTQLSEQAVDVNTLDKNQPIFATSTNHNSSIIGVANTIKNISPKGIFAFGAPYKNNATVAYAAYGLNSSTTSTQSFVDKGYFTPMCFATANNLTQTAKTCSFYAYVAVQTAGNTGQLQISSSLANTSVSFTNTTPGWVSGTIILPTENLALKTLINSQTINGITGNLQASVKKSVSIDGSYVSCWTLQIFENMT